MVWSTSFYVGELFLLPRARRASRVYFLLSVELHGCAVHQGMDHLTLGTPFFRKEKENKKDAVLDADADLIKQLTQRTDDLRERMWREGRSNALGRPKPVPKVTPYRNTLCEESVGLRSVYLGHDVVPLLLVVVLDEWVTLIWWSPPVASSTLAVLHLHPISSCVD